MSELNLLSEHLNETLLICISRAMEQNLPTPDLENNGVSRSSASDSPAQTIRKRATFP